MKIFKFELGRQPILMPRGAKALYVGEQENDLYIWMLCDEMATAEERMFMILATGEQFGNYADISVDWVKKHIGTVQQSNGLVWHVLE